MPSQTFTTSGTFTVPGGVTTLQIECYGGDGGGSVCGLQGGAAGGGGTYARLNTYTTTPGSVLSVTVGAAGSAGVHGGVTPGGGGGSSYVVNTSTVLAVGGGGANDDGGATPYIGGIGGLAASCVGDVKHSGGNGGNSSSSGGPYGGAGGGGTATSTGNGGNGSNVSGSTGAAGGALNGGTGGNLGSNGFSGGGGGGGGGYDGMSVGSGGSGGGGTVVITWTSSTPDLPPLQQRSQRWDALPNFNLSWWEQYRFQPVPVTFLPGPPVIGPAHSQRWDALPDLTTLLWQQHRLWPNPTSYIPPPPPTRQPSQFWLPEPEWTQLWWEQYRFQPLPSTYFTAQEGTYGVYSLFIGISQGGDYRVQNNIERYNVYVGIGALPDLTQTPTAFAQTLPINVSVTPPVSGHLTFHVLVTKQDTYGLNSQNQFYYTVTIDQFGNLIMPTLPVPQNLKLVQGPGGVVRLLAYYPTVTKDQYPADTWRVWHGNSPPDITTIPQETTPVSGAILASSEGPFSPGVVYFAVTLYRTADASQSPALRGSITISSAPPEVTAVPSGFDGA